MQDPMRVTDSVMIEVGKGCEDQLGLHGYVVAELFDKDGTLLRRVEGPNLITNVGDQMYGERGCGITTTAIPVGMRLGTQVTPAAAAKSGANSTLQAFLSGSSVVLDATYPQSAAAGNTRVITYKVTWGAGVATTASAITEAVLTNDAVATAWTSGGAGVQANTISRFLLTGIGSKGATDTLALTWTHTLAGT
jgi:hypothetical protein